MKRFEKISGDSWVSGMYVADQMPSKSHSRPTVIHACRHTGRHTGMEIYKQTDTYTDGQIYPGRHIHRHKNRQK